VGVKSYITDQATGKSAEVVLNHKTERQGLVTATFPLRTFENSILFFTNSDYGVDMNIDASTGGTPEPIHDGTDSVIWTASDIVGGGKTTFNSTNQAYAGTKSIKVDNAPVDDVFQLTKASALDCTGYVSLTMWVYVDKDWKARDYVELYGWDTAAGSQVGTSVNLTNYFSYNVYDVWQKITIPLTDMGALSLSTTLDAFRVKQTAKEGKAPKYYLDTIQFEQTGTPVTYSLKPDKGTWLHVKTFTISVADALASTLADATMPNLAYNKLLGETLTSGVTYQRTQNDEVQFSQTVLGLLGFLQLPRTAYSCGSDGTNTWLTLSVEHIEPLVLKEENDDTLSWTISEDLSGLLHFRITAGCLVEQKE